MIIVVVVVVVVMVVMVVVIVGDVGEDRTKSVLFSCISISLSLFSSIFNTMLMLR